MSVVGVRCWRHTATYRPSPDLLPEPVTVILPLRQMPKARGNLRLVRSIVGRHYTTTLAPCHPRQIYVTMPGEVLLPYESVMPVGSRFVMLKMNVTDCDIPRCCLFSGQR
jgi:hypothetical protein